MKTNVKYITAAAILSMAVASCSHDVEYLGPEPESPKEAKVANTFDFKTTQDINLEVDFSAAGAVGAVYFDVFDENPIITTTTEIGAEVLSRNEALRPIYGGYTNADGRFSGKVTLPAYARHLYIVSSNMLLSTQLIEADVNGSSVKAIATARSDKGATRAVNAGNQTNTIPENLYSWGYNTANGYGGDGMYKPRSYSDVRKGNGGWYAPLGTWDEYTGRPNYLLDRNNSANKELVFSDEELRGLFELIGNAVDRERECKEEYRAPGDLTLQRNSEVAINMLGGSTMWHSTLGYYYYNGSRPADIASTPIIMLFPNTMDGNTNFGTPLVGVNRGDAIKLVYYPNIANGDLSGATTEFPAGTSIGFVLKTNGWASWLDDNGSLPGGVHSANLNWWCTSTDGLSFCDDNVESGASKLGKNTSRTAKFAYTSGGDEFAVISFEDMNHDKNFADVAFALKPASAFQPLPQVVNKVVDESGVYAFEDLWPSKGDYDMNDVLVDYKYSRELKKYENESDQNYKTYRESFSFTTYQNYAALHSGLAFSFQLADNPTSTIFKKRRSGSSSFEDADFTVEDDNVVILTNDINNEIGTEYLVEVTYENGTSRRTSIKPFIFRDTEGGKRLEVHVPFEAPTAKVDMSLFGTEDDLSDPANGIYYVRAGNYPYAFYLANGDINAFKNTLLNSAYEQKPIDTIYPLFIDWATSGGKSSQEWYK